MMNIFGSGKFIEKLDGLVFHRENLMDEDRLFIDNFVKQHQLAYYSTASELNSRWVINQDKSSLMFYLGGGLPTGDADGSRMPVAYGLIFEGQPLVFKADITSCSVTQAHWNILGLIIHPTSFFSKIPKNTIFKIIDYFVKNGYQSERLSKFIPNDIEVNFSTCKRIKAVGESWIFGDKS